MPLDRLDMDGSTKVQFANKVVAYFIEMKNEGRPVNAGFLPFKRFDVQTNLVLVGNLLQVSENCFGTTTVQNTPCR